MRNSRMRWPYPRTPALGRNLTSELPEAKCLFDQRVKAQFPVGSSETSLVEELRKQGFAIGRDYRRVDWRSASITRGMLIKTLWSVRWRAKAGQIEDIWGVYGFIAP